MTHIGLAIDPATNDLFLAPDGNLATVADALAVGQHVRQRLKTFEGEWFLDTSAGVPWLDEVLGRQPDTVIAEALIKAEILETVGITGISSFSIRFNQERREIDGHSIVVETVYHEEVAV